MRTIAKAVLRRIWLAMSVIGCLLTAGSAQAISTWSLDTYLNISFANANETGLRIEGNVYQYIIYFEIGDLVSGYQLRCAVANRIYLVGACEDSGSQLAFSGYKYVTIKNSATTCSNKVSSIRHCNAAPASWIAAGFATHTAHDILTVRHGPCVCPVCDY